MEVVAAAPGGGGVPPFHDHDVREWSRIDSITGALERARLETDSWTANTNTSHHKYGKVVDSRARTGADGAVQQQARRQLEVFQSQVPGGHLQVIKTHTVSSSRWTSSTATGNGVVTDRQSGRATEEASDGFGRGFEDLKLSVNHLDLTSQKSKASVGRSVSRRPPSRQPRFRDVPQPSQSSTDATNPLRNPHITASTNLHRVSRLCHQIHENAVRQAFGGKRSPPISERQNGDGSASGVEIYEIESSATSSSETKSVNGHTNLTRTKSTSSDDIHQIPERDFAGKGVEDLEDLEQLQNWRRTSKIRRSLQFPKHNKTTTTSIPSKPIDLPENSVNVRKIREDLEKGRRLNTALRNNSVDLEALDQILQSISSSSSGDKTSTDDTLDDLENDQLISKPKQKRDSFVTVESLKEVRGRLRKTSSPTHDIYKTNKEEEEADDGIVTEDTENSSNFQNRVRSYVYGMEAMINKKPTALGTGSLESRSKLVNGNNSNRNEDWYNRRKSYGFEQVHGHEEATNSISFKNKNVVESSTDSGICRSSEIVLVPTATKTNNNHNNHNRFDEQSDSESETGKYNGYDNKISNGINYGNVRRMTNIFNQDEKTTYYNKNVQDELTKPWSKQRASLSGADWRANELKSTTITIPIVKNNNVVDLSWNDDPEKDLKRHSIAVDESKYVTKQNDNKYRRTSLAANENFSKPEALDDENGVNNRKKKVEFCKTEVHFAADSGKVNIVETDEKPPPTQNFRRRRRNSGPITNFNEDFNKNGLPMLHFGDSDFEKTMFGITGDDASGNIEVSKENNVSDTENGTSSHHRDIPPIFGVVTVNTMNNTTTNQSVDYQEEDRREQNNENDNIKGILKNKPIKPKPYHLGETIHFSDTNSDEESKKWGVKLKPVFKQDNNTTTSTPVWKSTVTVHNSYYDKEEVKKEQAFDNYQNDEQPEFQKLLRKLRPTKRPDYMSDNENRYSDSFSNIRIVTPLKDTRRSSWSVADKVKLPDDGQASMENKGYSTKVNFGDGEAIVVRNEDNGHGHTTWPRSENLSNDSKHILNKGLVVRIGRQDSATKHTVCSKMTTTQDINNSTTTTKITIDLSPSPPLRGNNKEVPPKFTYAKYQRSHNFKSTSLILNTIKDSNESKFSRRSPELEHNVANKVHQQLDVVKRLYDYASSNTLKGSTEVKPFYPTSEPKSIVSNKIPEQLEALKKLYEDVPSDSDADKEVQLLMSKMTEKDLSRLEDSSSSVVSGSWSKMRAYKNISEASRSSFKEAKSRFDLKVNAQLEKDTTERLKPTTTIPVETKNNSAFKKFDIHSSRNKLSPVVLRKTLPITNAMTELKTASTMTTEKLSSPSLVGRNSYSSNFESPTRLSAKTITGRLSPAKDRKSPSRSRSKSPIKDHKPGRDSPVKTVTDNLLQTNMVLRQPKKSEMTYFGVNISPKPAKKISQAVIKKEISKLSEKPDLLHHHHKKQRTPSPNRKTKPQKSPPRTSPGRDPSPIYENIDKITNKETNKAKRYGITREFDSSILDELTKAADQILQAVNGYTDEDCHNRLSSDDECKIKIEPLETISETKSTRQAHHETHTKASKAKVTSNVRSRIKRTSSTSSIESLSKDRRKVTSSVTLERSKAVASTTKLTSSSEKSKKKVSNDSSSSSKANTKARRLQRASSREALLQSHGSSSEDLTANVEVPVRKPRLVKKTKAAQLTITNGLEFKKPSSRRKEEVASSKPDERILHSLPEIRHKTAVSTIRSTAEKCSRDRSRQRSEELKGKMQAKKEISKSAPTSSSRPLTRNNNNRSGATTATNSKETVTHRISTANIKKCHRSEGVPRHKE